MAWRHAVGLRELIAFDPQVRASADALADALEVLLQRHDVIDFTVVVWFLLWAYLFKATETFNFGELAEVKDLFLLDLISRCEAVLQLDLLRGVAEPRGLGEGLSEVELSNHWHKHRVEGLEPQ